MLVPSRYNVPRALDDGGLLLHNTRSGALVVLSATEHRALGELLDGAPVDATLRQGLVDGGFVVDEHTDELALLHQAYRRARDDDGTLSLTLVPTLGCNFACDYCFQGQDKPTGTMSEQVQDAIIALVQQQAPAIRAVSVTWFGGEPLLRLELVLALSERLQRTCLELGLVYAASVVTNGWRLTGEVARKLAGAGVREAQVTFDGAEQAHDRRRALRNGTGSYQRLLGNLQSVVQQRCLPLSLRINVDARNEDGLETLLGDLAARGLGESGLCSVYFAPVEAITEACHDIAGVTLQRQHYAELEARCIRMAMSLGLHAPPRPPRFHGLCVATRPRGLVINPDGALHKCWDTTTVPERAVGSLFALEALADDPRLTAWERWTPFDDPGCRSCKLLPSCAGACAHKTVHAQARTGDAAQPCPSWKFNLGERLVMAARSQGALHAEPVAPLTLDELEIGS